MADDVVLEKAAIIERCLARIAEEYRGREAEFETNLTRQDAIMLNLLRACEAAIDCAMHVVRVRKLGLPADSRAAYTMLQSAGLLEQALSLRMQAMVGFRNVAIHNYRALDLAIVRAILDTRLDDFRRFVEVMIRAA
jgi:uncharacterized protein YutE (UPF0331/DUF86 family)